MEVKTDLVGKKIGRLQVVGIHETKQDAAGKTRTYFKCVCDCGVELIRPRDGLVSKSSKVKSCGCYKREFLSKQRKTHGMSDTRFHNIYLSMRKRIFNKNHRKYKHYGGRGITIAPQWLGFNGFKCDMYESYLKHVEEYGEKNTTLERKDPDQNYTPENCTWATIAEQNKNRRDHHKPFKATNLKTGETFISSNKAELARKLGISDKHIGTVLNGNRKSTKGYTFEYLEG